MGQNYWWITRPKRKLNVVPEELMAFYTVAGGKKWSKNKKLQLELEDELENSKIKREGERRDNSGSGGRTHAIWLYSLGLWFEKNDTVFLTLAGEALLNGKNPVPILKKQVLKFQYPSAYSNSARIKVSERFKIRPFVFLLQLLLDSRINYLSQDEIAFIVMIQAETNKDESLEKVIKMIEEYRSNEMGWQMFGEDYLKKHGATEANLLDIANTIMNWLEYTQLIYREKKKMGILEEKRKEVEEIVKDRSLIKYPLEDDVYQRKYGVDPEHQKDIRNLLDTKTISSISIETTRIKRAFLEFSATHCVNKIDDNVINYINGKLGIEEKLIKDVLDKTWPHGAIGCFLVGYMEMAFKGKDEAVDFEKATTNIFQDVFGYNAIHLGQTGSKSAPDVLLVSDNDGYQAIIDNKAYHNYTISGDHHNRMVYNYIKGISSYSQYNLPLGFFSYISGGFGKNIDDQIKKIADATQVNGSCITVSRFIEMIEKHEKKPYSHEKLREIFGVNKEIITI